MKEFEEFEGLSSVAIDESALEENNDDDPSFRPADASALTSSDMYYEVSSFFSSLSTARANSSMFSWKKED